MRWKYLALVFIYSLASFQAVLAEERSVKATTPVEVSIFPVTAVNRGEVATFTVYATSAIPSENFVIEIRPSAGSELVSGSLRWQGAIFPGQAHESSITLRMAKDSVPTVTVSASLEEGGVIQFAASETYRQQVHTPVAVQTVSKERKVKRKGKQVIEYRVK